ncbi:MAG: LCP family protein [Clostridia bacterium]|nr:LCP family protein [Clostridia bacterium]
MFKRNHKFKTAKQDKRSGMLNFLYAFLAFALVFGSISAVVILKHNDISLEDIFSDKTVAVTDNDRTDTLDTVDLNKELSGQANILLYCAQSDASAIHFLIMVDADMDDRTFRVHPLGTENPEYLTALSRGGYKELIAAVEKHEGVEIDKYVASNPDTFALAINYMGGLEYTVDERIEYRTDDYTLILTQGDQTIKGETLLKFFKYCKTLGTDGMRRQGQIVCAMIDNFITAENVEKGITIYQKVLSKINSASDVSYVEMSSALQMLKLLCASDERQPATVILSLESISQ